MSYHVPEVKVYIHLRRVGVCEVAEHYGLCVIPREISYSGFLTS